MKNTKTDFLHTDLKVLRNRLLITVLAAFLAFGCDSGGSGGSSHDDEGPGSDNGGTVNDGGTGETDDNDSLFKTFIRYNFEGPTYLTLADFNNDGRLDVIGSYASGTDGGGTDVKICLQNADMSFTIRNVNLGTPGASSGRILNDDFNNDGNRDFAVISSGIRIYLGNGDGTFLESAPLTAVKPYFASGDFNNDGNSDIAAEYNQNTIYLYPGNGDGTFGSPVVSTVAGSITSIYTGEMNGDASPDLVITYQASGTSSYYMSVLAGNGNGGFVQETSYAIKSYSGSVRICDLNRDGINDIVFGNWVNNTGIPPYQGGAVYVFIGNGNGTYQTRVDYFIDRFSADNVMIGDFNNDGRIDIAAACCDFWQLQILNGNGDGTFTPAPERFGIGSPISTETGDFNGDGRPDFIIGGNSDNLKVVLSKGNGDFDAPSVFLAGTSPEHLLVLDINGDGFSDVITANKNGDDISVLTGRADGKFNTAVNYDTDGGPTELAAGDLNKDGHPDLVVAAQGDDNVNIFMGNGDGTFAVHTDYDVTLGDLQFVCIADFNNDGNPDIAMGIGSTVQFLIGNGTGAFTKNSVQLSAGSDLDEMKALDFNGDGNIDIIAGTRLHGVIFIPGNGNGTFGTPIKSGKYNEFEMTDMIVRDFNGDGQSDIAIFNNEISSATDTVSVLYCGTNFSVTAQSTITLSDCTNISYQGLCSGEFNGDAFPDIVTSGDNNIKVLKGQALGFSDPVEIYPVKYTPYKLESGDFNHDGKTDIAIVDRGTLTILYHR